LIATVVGTSLAIVGFITWRREHVAKRRAELAEETLARIYEAKEAIEYIRAYYCLPHELSARKAEGAETPEQKAARDEANVIAVRYSKIVDVFTRLRAARYSFQACFGSEAAQPIEQLNLLVWKIRNAAGLWGKDRVMMLGTMTDSQRENCQRRIDKNEAIIFEGGGLGEDEVKKELGQIVSKIETICRPAIILRDNPQGFWASVAYLIQRLIESGREKIEESKKV